MSEPAIKLQEPVTIATSGTDSLSPLSDEELQSHLLQGVSRTFALTIPQLPPSLCRVVSNAYLLCRIVDTIEDEPALSSAQKRQFCEQFADVVSGRDNAETLSAELSPLLSEQTIRAEHELIKVMPRVLKITHGFTETERHALERCIRIMADGMAFFQETDEKRGLPDLAALDRYCYHVAGVVGEMLCALFCDYSTEIAQHREALMKLSVSFGQGLQMTNIIKDIWDDKERSACWLPRDIFQKSGYDLKDLETGANRDKFGQGLEQLIGIAHNHLRNALAYVLLIPAHETGIRKFCLWAIGMAVLNLRKINNNREFTRSADVKISRRSVKATILATHITVRHNRLLKLLFNVAARRLPSVSLSAH